MFGLFKKNKEKKEEKKKIKKQVYTKLVIKYIQSIPYYPYYRYDTLEIKGKVMPQEFKDLEKWWLTSKKRYFKVVYDKGVLLLDKEKILTIRIYEVEKER